MPKAIKTKLSKEKIIVKNELIILRGPSGSGKSTYALNQYPLYICVSADDFFMEDGVYLFQKEKLKQAHEWCFDTVIKNLKSGKNVVVANTFRKQWEINKYINFCDKIYKIQILYIKNQFTSIHNVSPKIIEEYYIDNDCENDIIVNIDKNKTSEMINKYNILVPKNRFDQNLSEFETLNWIDNDNVKNIITNNMYTDRNASFLKNIKNLLAHLYFFIPPIRSEWCKVKIIYDELEFSKEHCLLISANRIRLYVWYGDIEVIELGDIYDELCKKCKDGNICATCENYNCKMNCTFNYNLVKNIIRESLELYPRKYLFSKFDDFEKPILENDFLSMLSTIIFDYTSKKMNIVLMRKIFLDSYRMKKCDCCRGGKFMSCWYEVQIAQRMMINSHIYLDLYVPFYDYFGKRLKP